MDRDRSLRSLVASAVSNAIATVAVSILWFGVGVAHGQDDFYGSTPADQDPPIDELSGLLQGDGTASGVLPAEDMQSGNLWAHVVFFANLGDDLMVDTNGSTPDTKLAILFDVHGDGIQIGDAPPSVGTELSFEHSDDDGGDGSSSFVSFIAPYSGAFLASISEFDDEELNWRLTVSGSTYSGNGLGCDLNSDGQCDATDIDIFFANGDAGEVVDWLAEASTPANPYLQGTKTFVGGDTNLDGQANSQDLGLLLNNFGSNASLSWGAGNLNGDLLVDSVDLGLMLNNFGHQSSASVAVPEPGCFPSVMIVVAAMAIRRRST